MALRYTVISSCRHILPFKQFGFVCMHDANKCIIGNRDVVGFGKNGNEEYFDHPEFPMPAIRWKENSPVVLALRQKEKGDWRRLTLDEKKHIYRASFCQTYAEMLAPTGEWKGNVGTSLILISCGVWLFILMKIFVYSQTPLPESFSEESQKAQLKRMLDIRANPITGISSKWNYKHNNWK